MQTAAATSLDRAEWQRIVFAERPRRADLLTLPAAGGEPLRINVHRNRPFEPVAACASPFLRYAGWDASFVFSDYDDSLSFSGWRPADVELIWLDFARYRPFDRSWLEGRIRWLRNATAAPILVPAPVDGDLAVSMAGVRICPQGPIQGALGSRYLDSRTGVDLSGEACVETARHLAFVWLPPALRPRIKAIAVDLDNTLYHGVLGEDGVNGVEMTPAHAELQRRLVELQESGALLAIVSKNERADVESLFDRRRDFPLRREHFSAVSASWGPKSAGLRAAAAEMRIALEAVLFIDDNPGELAEAAAHNPGLHTLHASSPLNTVRALKLYPGLNGYTSGDADRLRAADLAAASRRAREQAASADPGEYLASLQIEIGLALDRAEDVHRLHELSMKTNQFNTGFLRLSEAQTAERIASEDCPTASIRLRDRLSDSGLVGAIFTRLAGETLHVEEIALSCRALGRQIEDVMIREALAGIAARHPEIREILFSFQAAPRNAPARQWLARFTGAEPAPGDAPGVPRIRLESRDRLPVSIVWQT